ncbi:DUF3341 domain-containing protein [Truepera radiovictrix]|uniref:Quinol:cytochrome c oxidoreductase membrane protein n=1 Tax=Truepera radiovictrix (strain DSM 17093 / CIP 108686 / LMG 22925 / RQ-24) TaxID=649638 RepID=D7CVC3_TRURR|nr:DUF3341 domain-containing protein [Truepera radiovictrix]ADI14151.1 conserved hypothetical protein [Truepera radiovictrix DSM 17093]WMT57287.1 DUF3341 domain-containing protein [Truepera radiovictrix]
MAHAVPAATAEPELYGLVAEFETPEALLEAANAAREEGYTKMDAYTPFPVTGLDEALGMSNTRLGWVVLIMGLLGGASAFFMQWFAQVVHYPLNIGGRPLNAWPNYIVITFEVTVLLSAFTAGLFMLARNGLPRPYHPIFNTPNFEAATRDRFFLCIEASDPEFDLGLTARFLEKLGPVRVSEVEA